MIVENPGWPPTLEYLLEWTQTRLPNRMAMQKRFGLLLQMHSHYLPRSIVKITGTNGKGSVCAMLEASLQADGKSVGMFTSPHLTRITERIRINGIEISDSEMEQHALELRHILEQWVAQMGLDYLPSFFEILIIVALRAFHNAGVDVAIFEAGIGGTNDAVSIIPGQLAAITSIGMDHVAILGNSLAAIALDKAGIASAHSQLVLGPKIGPDLIGVVASHCQETACLVTICNGDSLEIQQHSLKGMHFTYLDFPYETSGFLNLAGIHQIENLTLTLKLLSILHQKKVITDFNAACLGLSRVNWPCRLTLIQHQTCWLLDVAHNAHGIDALAHSLDLLLPFEERILLWGTAQDKDYLAYINELPKLAPKICLVEGFNRSASTSQLAGLLPRAFTPGDISQFTSIASAINGLNSQFGGSGKTVIVAGSVFLSGAVLNALSQKSN